LVPQKEIIQNPAMLYIAIGILGATVMPHNLYLHSSIVQTRDYTRIRKEKRGYQICDFRQYCFFDAGFFINAAILFWQQQLSILQEINMLQTFMMPIRC
jgi:manganese transport protein